MEKHHRFPLKLNFLFENPKYSASGSCLHAPIPTYSFMLQRTHSPVNGPGTGSPICENAICLFPTVRVTLHLVYLPSEHQQHLTKSIHIHHLYLSWSSRGTKGPPKMVQHGAMVQTKKIRRLSQWLPAVLGRLELSHPTNGPSAFFSPV